MSQLDVRTIQPRERHPMIFDTFDALQLGESFELVNDHAPTPLYYQFLHERTDLFSWVYEEEGRTFGVSESRVPRMGVSSGRYECGAAIYVD